MKISKELIEDLNLLLARNNDAHKGYTETAQNVNRTDIRTWMQTYAGQRELFCEDLKNEIVFLGGEADDSTSILGELHRVWIDLKGSTSDDEPEAMLEECERGETEAFNNYGDVMSKHKDMPASTRRILEQHQRSIKEALAEVKIMLTLVENEA